jgi:hypothetical protein
VLGSIGVVGWSSVDDVLLGCLSCVVQVGLGSS